MGAAWPDRGRGSPTRERRAGKEGGPGCRWGWSSVGRNGS